MVNNNLAILLSTFNSEIYLEEQIDSLLDQTHKDWKLYIRDDGSSDATIQIIENYCNEYPNIVFIKDELHNLGAKNSFIKLLSDVSSAYYMFCDHDDVWLPLKIEKTFNRMKEAEDLYPGKPLLIFTDMKVVDKDLHVIHDSMWKYQRTNPNHAKNFYYLSVSNPVTGCTVMINQLAKEISIPMSHLSLMHDLWIALKVSYYGYVDFVNEPLILYRQHGKNFLGAKVTNSRYYLVRFKNLKKTIEDNLALTRMINSLNIKICLSKRLLIKLNVFITKLLH